MRSGPRLTRPRPRILFPNSSINSSGSNNNNDNGKNTKRNSSRATTNANRKKSSSKMASAATATAPGDHSSSSSSGGLDYSIPPLFTSSPPIRDALDTLSSELQDQTVNECLPFLTGYENESCNAHGIPRLDRDRHIAFLHRQLGKLPGAFTPADPSRPWILYWCLSALTILGHDVAPEYRQRLVDTVRPMQNPQGGFAGGFGQTSHLATTYASVLALALVGEQDAYDVVDRRAMWRWLCSLKQPDGGFQMALGGEEDVRGAYCAAVIISLLNIPLNLSPDSPAYAAGHTGLFDGLADYVRSCQTFEGGVSATPGIEAHGAYAFCALGCLSIIDSPHRSIPQYLNVPLLISWLSSRQYAPEGGFSGRTNKLVDGCYSHWVGGCWPLIEAALNGPVGAPAANAQDHPPTADATRTGSLFSRDGLIRYILSCCQDQSKRGGLRDKPSKYSDAYHTCYVLSGLSSAQHKWDLVTPRAHQEMVTEDSWTVTPYMEGQQIFDEADRVCTVHPVYVIPQHKVDAIQSYFASKTGF